MRKDRHDRGTAGLKLWRVSLLSTAVTMAAAVAHLLELPGKMRYEPPLWVRLHRTLYPTFGRAAGPAEPAAVVATGVLAWRAHRYAPEAFRSTTIAATCLAAAHAIYWGVVRPVNVEVVQWALDDIPHDWTTRRDRWEYGHAVRAGLATTALVALTMSCVAMTRSHTVPPAAA